MSERYFRPQPTQANCSRCRELFVYFRTTKPRMLCAPCVPLEATDANRFYANWRSVQRNAARLNGGQDV